MRSARLILLVAALFALPAIPGRAQNKPAFAEVEVRELKANPQRHWAQGIVFKDRLLKLPRKLRAETMGERKVIRFETQILGECYADERLKPVLQDLEPDRDYLFSGTVYQHKRRFYVVISQLTTALENLSSGAELAGRLDALREGSSPAARQLNAVLTAIQAELLGHAEADNVEMEALFVDDEQAKDRVRQAVRNGIARLEEETHAPAAEFLAQLLYTLVRERYAPAEPEPAPAPAPAEPEPAEAAPAPEETPVPEIVMPEHLEPGDQVLDVPALEAPAEAPVADETPAETPAEVPAETSGEAPAEEPVAEEAVPAAGDVTTEEPVAVEPVPAEPAPMEDQPTPEAPAAEEPNAEGEEPAVAEEPANVSEEATPASAEATVEEAAEGAPETPDVVVEPPPAEAEEAPTTEPPPATSEQPLPRR